MDGCLDSKTESYTSKIHNNNRSSSKEGEKQHQRTSESIFIVDVHETQKKRNANLHHSHSYYNALALIAMARSICNEWKAYTSTIHIVRMILFADLWSVECLIDGIEVSINQHANLYITLLNNLSVMGIILIVTNRSIYVSDGKSMALVASCDHSNVLLQLPRKNKNFLNIYDVYGFLQVRAHNLRIYGLGNLKKTAVFSALFFLLFVTLVKRVVGGGGGGGGGGRMSSYVIIMPLTLLSFLYQVRVASGLPPDETHNNFCTEPAGIICPSI
uniref:Uncharacterized protein n=1 Tax=Glossina austeni TaxID=7395 RepID=A0A1A9VXK4_GLOAU